ncbi:MAG: hypothetical protein H7834_09690 [Magnetococcus sp. YQC-9]
MPASPSIDAWVAKIWQRLTTPIGGSGRVRLEKPVEGAPVVGNWRERPGKPIDWQGLFKRPKRSAEGMSALYINDEGVGLVHVEFPDGQLPKLDVCAFAPFVKGQTAVKLAQTLIKMHKLEKSRFVGVLDRGAYVLFPADAPEVPREEWGAAMKWRIKDQINFPVTQAVVEIFDMPGNTSRIYVAVAKESEVRKLAQLFQAVKAKLLAIDIPELALRNLVKNLPDDAEGVVMLHLERKSGVVMMIKRGRFYLARRLENGLELLQSALTPDGGGLSSSPFMDRIALEVQRTMDYFESHFGQAQAGGLQIAPLLLPIEGFRQALAERLGMRIKFLPIADILQCPEELSESELARALPAIGAALRGRGEEAEA